MAILRGIAVTGGVASVLLVAAPAHADIGAKQHTERVAVAGTVTSLVVRGEVGSITVVPGAVTRIVAKEQYNLHAPRLQVSLRHGLLQVAAPCPRPPGIIALSLNRCDVSFVITVPRKTAVRAFNEVGNIRVRDLRGSQSLRSALGDVVVSGVSARRIDASSDTGDVLLTVPAGTYAVHAHTGTGDAHVRGITVRSDAARVLSARSEIGDIRIVGR
jgi:hypothetical protein